MSDKLFIYRALGKGKENLLFSVLSGDVEAEESYNEEQKQKVATVFIDEEKVAYYHGYSANSTFANIQDSGEPLELIDFIDEELSKLPLE